LTRGLGSVSLDPGFVISLTGPIDLGWRTVTTVADDERERTWTFLTNHAHVLLCIVSDPEVRLRDVATSVGITERAAQRIVTELVDDGYLERRRVGRRNTYRVNASRPLRAPFDGDRRVEELIVALSPLSTS
jgi:predicted transcriptional regulator